MNAKDAIHLAHEGSDKERMTFPDVIGLLMSVGVERYHCDLVRAERTYYMPNGETDCLSSPPYAAEAAADFSSSGVNAAIRAIQAGQIGYRAFCDRVLAAGCVGYLVSMPGRRAVYYGRSGETFVEPFPGAA
ncbi:MAG: DUF1398 family protein [Proteobacteria bacterium]|nr:DUF1398 family protein [Pseudomonadota bacterium]